MSSVLILLPSRLHKLAQPFVRFYSSTPLQTLPWTEIKPFMSVRVNLTTAVSEGWALRHTNDFPHLLERESTMISTVNLIGVINISHHKHHCITIGHLAEWKLQNRSAVWLHIPIALGALIPLAAEKGFTIHHGGAEEVVMNQWLATNRPNKLPDYASHQVGVCGKDRSVLYIYMYHSLS